MSNSTQVAPATFSFQSQAIRVITKDGEPWFVAKDICDALELTNPTEALKSLDEDEKAKFNLGQYKFKSSLSKPTTPKQGSEVNIINESGLYTLILRSRQATTPGTAQHAFRKWVTCEVLPAIRKTGEFRMTITPEQQRAIQEAVAAKVAREGVSFQAVYQALKSRFRIPRYDLLPQSAFAECLAWLGAREADYVRRHQVAAVALMERGLRQHEAHAEVVRALWMRVADLGEVARHVAEELAAMRGALQFLDKSGAVHDGLHEAQAHLGFARDVLDEGRALAEKRLPERWQA